MNKVILIGFIGKDSELRYTKSNQPVAGFSLATSETYKDKDGNKQEKTTWHNIVLWGKRAEALNPYLTKGTRVAVEGKIVNESYEKQDGTKGYSMKIVVSDVELLGKGKGKDSTPETSIPAEDENFEDIPF